MPEGSPRSGSPSLARRAFDRPPISLALVGLIMLLTAATGATPGALAWREKHAGSRPLVDNAMAQAARIDRPVDAGPAQPGADGLFP